MLHAGGFSMSKPVAYGFCRQIVTNKSSKKRFISLMFIPDKGNVSDKEKCKKKQSERID